MLRRIRHWLATLVLLGLDFALIVLAGRPRLNRRKLLIVRLDNIGDLILWLDAARELRALHADADITLLGNDTWIDFAAGQVQFDRAIGVDRRKIVHDPLYRWRVLREIRAGGYDRVIQPTYSRELLYGDSIVHACGARERTGSAGDLSNRTPFERWIGDRWYTRLVSADPAGLGELERNAEFARGLGAAHFRARTPEIRRPLARAGRLGDYYVLCPGGSIMEKRWPPSRFAEIARRMHEATGARGVICGAAGEEALGRRIVAEAGVELEDRVGSTSLEELVAVIAGSRLLVGNDTSGIHIAAAVSTPAVAVLGGGHFGRFLPYPPGEDDARTLPVSVVHEMPCFGCNWRCIYAERPEGRYPCVADVSVDDVWRAVEGALFRARLGIRSPGNE